MISALISGYIKIINASNAFEHGFAKLFYVSFKPKVEPGHNFLIPVTSYISVIDVAGWVIHAQ